MKKQTEKNLTKQDIQRRLEEIKEALNVCFSEQEALQKKITTLQDEYDAFFEILLMFRYNDKWLREK